MDWDLKEWEGMGVGIAYSAKYRVVSTQGKYKVADV